MDVQSQTGVRLTRQFRRDRRFRTRTRPIPPPPVDRPHDLLVTGKRNTNGKVLVVRCACMAECYRPGGPKRTYYNYDSLAEVTSLEEVARVYAEHLAAKR